MSTASLLDAGTAVTPELEAMIDARTAIDTSDEAQPPAEQPHVVRDSALLLPGGATGSMSGSSATGTGAAGGLSAALPPLGCGQQNCLNTRLNLARVLKPQPPALGGVFHPPREK